MIQSKRRTLAEVIVNYAIGFVVAWACTPFIMATFGYQAGAGKSFGITLVYSLLAMFRSYGCRRVFNHLDLKRLRKEGRLDGSLR